MPTADRDDPASLERAYPLDTFARDAALNARPAAAELHGVRIAAAADGGVELRCATRQAGETAPSDDALFLAPHRSDEAATTSDGRPGYGGPQAAEATSPEATRGAYEAFLARIAETIREAHLQPPIGLHEDRLKGLRGG